jgi:hypothetical protein
MVSRAGIDIGTMIVGIMSITTGTIIAIGTTTGIATVATSTSMTTTRGADIVALGTDATIHIVEIKSSVADFRADTKWHYRAHCNRLFFAIPETVPVEIMPQDAGLILADSYGADMAPKFCARRRNIAWPPPPPPGGAHAFCARGGASAASLERSRGARGGRPGEELFIFALFYLW